MKQNTFYRRAPVTVLALALFATAAVAETLRGRVVEIADGDTLTLLVERQRYPIRIASIDAPDRFQAWGDRSRTNLSRLALNQLAIANCAEQGQAADRVCTVVVNTRDLGLEQIQDGMAWYRSPLTAQSGDAQSAYAHAELMAKLRRLGLWSEINPVPPWMFRR
jgi:endonuclease YncB( thermonuclease family)